MTNLKQRTESVKTMRHRNHRRCRVLAVLGTVVVLATAIALMIPAISATSSTMPDGAFVAGSTSLSNHPAQSFSQDIDTTLAASAIDAKGSNLQEIADERAAYGMSEAPTIQLADAMTISVSVDAPEGALPAGATMKVTPVNDVTVLDAARKKAVNDMGLIAEAANTAAVDISFYDELGAEIEPMRAVNVTMTARQIAFKDDMTVVHVDDANVASVIDADAIDADEKSIAFTASSFSVYALVYTLQETDFITADGEAVTIIVTYADDAEIPAGSELSVREILPDTDEYEQYLSESAAQLDTDTGDISFARFFDIEIVKDGQKVEPTTPVQVNIAYKDALEIAEGSQLNVVHFAENGSEVTPETIRDVALNDEATEITYQQASFSVTGTIVAPPGKGDIDSLDGNVFTVKNGSNYLTRNTNYGVIPWGIRKTGDVNQAATFCFEATGTPGQYAIYTIGQDGIKNYLHINRNAEDGGQGGRVNLTEYGPMALDVSKNSDGTYSISRTIDGTAYYLNQFSGNGGDRFAAWPNSKDDQNSKMIIEKVATEHPSPGKEEFRIVLVKYGDDYYVVNNDGSLAKAEYNEHANTVTMSDPMMWKVEDHHVYFNSTEVGFDGTQQGSDWYRRFLDPSASGGWTEENRENIGDEHFVLGPEHSAEIDGRRVTWHESRIQNRPTNVESATSVNVNGDGTGPYSISNDSGSYLGIALDSNGKPDHLTGGKGSDAAAEFYFATPTDVNSSCYLKNTVNHIDISIAGVANVSVPLAYGNYYGPQGDKADPIKTVTSNTKIDLGESAMEDPSEQLRITADDIKRATITTTCNGTDINDAFYITGYSGNVANGLSNDQVRIEGSFLCADLRGTEYETVDKNLYNTDQAYKNAVNEARLAHKVEYTVTVIKTLTYNLVDPVVGQLYDEGGQPITVPIDVAFSASFTYWDDTTFGNECPAVRWSSADGENAWKAGGIDSSDWSGMDFKLGGNADDEKSPLVALEITKVVMDDKGNNIKLKYPVTNYFDIYEKKGASAQAINGDLTGLHVVDDNNHPAWVPDSRDATIHDGYGDAPWRTKHVTVGETGSAIVFDFNATDAMYYIVEKHDADSLPEVVVDKDGKQWTYVKTSIETEYVSRGDAYSDKTQHPNAMHVTEDFTRDSGSYASIPEVAGKFKTMQGVEKKEGFLEFFVYNIYEPKKYPVWIEKTNETGDHSLAGAEFMLYGPYESDRSTDNDDATTGRKQTEIGAVGPTVANELLKVGDLYDGIYYLYETKAPNGYNLLSAPLKITVDSSNEETNTVVSCVDTGDATSQINVVYKDKDDQGADLAEPYYQFRVTNNPGVELPHTGGSGTMLLTAFGLVLVICSCAFLILRQRKNRHRSELR